jgi:hypothetical protein
MKMLPGTPVSGSRSSVVCRKLSRNSDAPAATATADSECDTDADTDSDPDESPTIRHFGALD